LEDRSCGLSRATVDWILGRTVESVHKIAAENFQNFTRFCAEQRSFSNFKYLQNMNENINLYH